MMNTLRDSQWDLFGKVDEILRNVKVPPMGIIRQKLSTEKISNIEKSIQKELRRPVIGDSVHEGMSIGISVGSRGIKSIAEITRVVVGELKRSGAKPFIFPAMGSHGGATAEGQKSLLESLGVTEEFVGAPIKSTMETLVVGKTKQGQDVHLDAYAASADGIIVIGRIKAHSAFEGTYESGLMKMMAIGLGKQKGAQICHADGFGKLAEYIPDFGRVMLEKTPIIFSIGVVENGVDEPHTIEALAPSEIIEREPQLLKLSKRLMAKIPFEDIDVLIVDQIGKNISGEGMDPHVTGTFATPYVHGNIKVKRYVVLNITPESSGNALGIGMADFSTKKVFDQLDFDAMYPNSLTSTVPGPSKVPMIFKNDEYAVKAGVHCSNVRTYADARIVRILDSSHLTHLKISRALLPEVERNKNLEMLSDFETLEFDVNGTLAPF